VLLLKDAVGIDGEGVRDGTHRKHGRDRAGEAAVAILRPSHLVLGNEFFPFLLVVIETHAKNHQRADPEISWRHREYEVTLRGRFAPSGPEINQHHFPCNPSMEMLLSVGGGNGERRRHLGADQFRVVDVAQGALAVWGRRPVSSSRTAQIASGSVILL